MAEYTIIIKVGSDAAQPPRGRVQQTSTLKGSFARTAMAAKGGGDGGPIGGGDGGPIGGGDGGPIGGGGNGSAPVVIGPIVING